MVLYLRNRVAGLTDPPLTIDAIVVLPDHLHAVWTFDARGEYRLWQRWLWEHTIRDDRDFERHVDHIHWNPVKHSLVSCPADWPHSSFHRYVRLGLLPSHWTDGVAEAVGLVAE